MSENLMRRDLPADVAAARDEWCAAAPQLDAAVQPAIEALVATCRLALGTLEDLHRRVADATDLDLDSETRAVAIWELTGHAIALGHATLDQVEAGHTSQLGGTLRALIETHALVLAVTGGSDLLVRKWLRGDYVTPKEANEGRRELYKALMEQLNARGNPLELHPAYRAQRHELLDLDLDPDAGVVGVLDSINGRVYGNLSEAAHNRRGSVRRNVSTRLRSFAYRRHPDARERLTAAIGVASHVETTLLDAGEGLKELLGYDATIGPIVGALEILRRSIDGAQAAAAQLELSVS